MENLITIPISAPCHPCSSSTVCPALEGIVEEFREAVCDDLDASLREAKVERVRDLQEESSHSVVHSSPRVGSDRWRLLNGIHQMCPGPGRREQRATCSHSYLRRDSSRCPAELWCPGEPGRHSASPPSSILGALHSTVSWGVEELPSNKFGQSRLVLQGEELV